MSGTSENPTQKIKVLGWVGQVERDLKVDGSAVRRLGVGHLLQAVWPGEGYWKAGSRYPLFSPFSPSSVLNLPDG